MDITKVYHHQYSDGIKPTNHVIRMSKTEKSFGCLYVTASGGNGFYCFLTKQQLDIQPQSVKDSLPENWKLSSATPREDKEYTEYGGKAAENTYQGNYSVKSPQRTNYDNNYKLDSISTQLNDLAIKLNFLIYEKGCEEEFNNYINSKQPRTQ